jgi:predicted NBD/HSP70 family sugar kinase
VELVEVTGMTRSTVSNIVKDLVDVGVLRTAATSRNGRHAVQVSLVRGQGLVAGIHFSSRRLRLVIAESSGKVVAERSDLIAGDNRADTELDRAVILLAAMAEEMGNSLSDVKAVGVATAVPVDSDGSTPKLGINAGWEGVRIRDILQKLLSCPVAIGSEATLGALAEVRTGAASGFQTVVYLHAGYTISAGFVFEGQPFIGAGTRYGLLGHVSFDGDGGICRCGNRGCLETTASGRALVSQFRDEPGMNRLSDLVDTAIEGNPRTSRVISDAGRSLGIAAAAVCNLIDPDILVVGGELAATGELLLGPMRHALERFVVGGTKLVPEVVPGGWAPRSAIVGAVESALALLSSRSVVRVA